MVWALAIGISPDVALNTSAPLDSAEGGIDFLHTRFLPATAQARAIFGFHLRLHACARMASRRSRYAATLLRQPAFGSSNRAHPSEAGSTTARSRAQHRSAGCSGVAPGPTLIRSLLFVDLPAHQRNVLLRMIINPILPFRVIANRESPGSICGDLRKLGHSPCKIAKPEEKNGGKTTAH
jgi:hypothetical protein